MLVGAAKCDKIYDFITIFSCCIALCCVVRLPLAIANARSKPEDAREDVKNAPHEHVSLERVHSTKKKKKKKHTPARNYKNG